MSIGLNQCTPIQLIQGADGSSSSLGMSTTATELSGGGDGLGNLDWDPSKISGNSNNPQKPANFEAIFEEIDEELADNTSTSNTLVAEVIREIKGNEAEKERPNLVHDSVEMLGVPQVVRSENVSASMQAELSSMGFLVG